MRLKVYRFFLLVVVIILTTSNACAFSEEWKNSGLYYYIILDNGTVEITQYDGLLSKEEDLYIPNEIDGIPVSSIGISAFGMCLSLKKVTIPEGVTRIRDWAFSGSWNITTVVLPDSIESIDYYAFCECFALKEINLPANLKSIGDGVFSTCRALEALTIPDGVESIGSMTFCDCDNLKTLVIPSSVTSIGDYAFYRSFNQPPTVTVIVAHNSYAEQYCIDNNIPYGNIYLNDYGSQYFQ